MNKINSYLLCRYASITNSLNNFRDDERGLSGIVVTVLLILVAVLAVGMVWGLLSGWLSDLWTTITGTAKEIK